jgi:hypothetical protein
VLVAALLLLPSLLHGQLAVRGHVRDQQGQPLTGAQVMVVGTRMAR